MNGNMWFPVKTLLIAGLKTISNSLIFRVMDYGLQSSLRSWNEWSKWSYWSTRFGSPTKVA